MLLAPKGTIIYGPVRSRRLGWSLGINALPPYLKTCTFDCLYCQYGRAAPVSPDDVATGFPSVDEIIDAVVEALADDIPRPAYLTFSGNGEPTLHPHFSQLVDAIRELRDRLIPTARVAALSNSSIVGKPQIAEALQRLDVRIMKLDAGNSEMFQTYNRPFPGLDFGEMVKGLASLADTTLQTLLTDGPQGNAPDAHIDSLIKCMQQIRPRAVQLYSLDRDSPTASLVRLDRERLESIAGRFREAGIPATAF
jgi:wyosine [tRNA(Phe)-imidazoG37] synthetase (radical SAM superfamily)